MTALTAARTIKKTQGKLFNYPVAANAVIYLGALVCLSSTGYAVKGSTATTLVPVGLARQTVDNTGGADGDLTIEVEEVVTHFDNSAGGDEITRAEIGDMCWIVDDQTVAKTSAGGTRSIAGHVRQVDDDGVWVQLRNNLSPDGDLVAANNLSDVGSAATARANIGANKVALTVPIADLIGANAEVYRGVSPVAGTVTKIWTVTDAALATGNATVTGSIGGVAITNGAVTITQAGSAAGDIDSATPTAANTVSAGSLIALTVGGTNSGAAGALATIMIET